MSSAIKRRLACMLAMIGALALPACADPWPRRVIVAWHTLSEARERALLQLVDRWNQTNDEGVIVIAERREPAAQHRALLAGATTGLLPDLALVLPEEAALYARRALLSPLDLYADSDDPTVNWDAGDRADLFPFVQQAGRTPQGQLLGVPFGGVTQVLLGNRDWLNSLGQADMPTNWEAFDKVCEDATDRILGTACYGFNPNDGSAIDWLYARGAPIYDPATTQLQIPSSATVSALTSLLDDLQSGQAYLIISTERSRDDFAAARVLFAFVSTDQLGDFARAVQARANFELDVGTLPAMTNTPAASIRAPLWVVPKRTRDRQRVAWKFLRWLLEPQQTAYWATETGEIPARLSALALMRPNPEQPLDALRAKLLQRGAALARPVPLFSGWPCVQAELSGALRRIIEGQPLEDTLLVAQTQAQNLLDADCTLR